MNTTLPTATILATQSPGLERWRWRLLRAWQSWRAHSRRQAEQRTIEALGDATLRDIGLAERRLPRPAGLSWADHERGRW